MPVLLGGSSEGRLLRDQLVDAGYPVPDDRHALPSNASRMSAERVVSGVHP